MRVKGNKPYEVRIKTDNRPVAINITVGTSPANVLSINGFNENSPNTMLFSRDAEPGEKKAYRFGVPMTGKFLTVLIFSEKPQYDFDVFKVEVSPITEFKSLDFKFDKKTEEFQAFVKKFSFEFFNYMPGTYTDKKKQFRIKIVEEITDTPARYASVADVIEVSKAAFDLVSVPIRTILISHEYAHKAMNRNIDDEFEADINSLKLFLDMKYPVIEGWYAFQMLTPGIYSKERQKNAEEWLDAYESKLMFDE